QESEKQAKKQERDEHKRERERERAEKHNERVDHAEHWLEGQKESVPPQAAGAPAAPAPKEHSGTRVQRRVPWARCLVIAGGRSRFAPSPPPSSGARSWPGRTSRSWTSRAGSASRPSSTGCSRSGRRWSASTPATPGAIPAGTARRRTRSTRPGDRWRR